MSRAGEDAVTLARPGEYYAPAGVSVFFNGPGGLVGLTPAPLYQSGPAYRWAFDASVGQRVALGALPAEPLPLPDQGGAGCGAEFGGEVPLLLPHV